MDALTTNLYQMKKMEFILKYHRFRATFFDVYKIALLNFGIIALMFVGLLFVENEQFKISLLVITAILEFVMNSFLFLNLFEKLSFKSYINNLSREENLNIVMELIEELSLSYTVTDEMISISYPLKSVNINLKSLELKQNIHLIPRLNSLLVNVRYADLGKLTSRKDNIYFDILDRLCKKMVQTHLLENVLS